MANNQISQKKRKEKEKNKYVRIELCSIMRVSALLLKLLLVSRQFWHPPRLHSISDKHKNRKLEHAISFN